MWFTRNKERRREKKRRKRSAWCVNTFGDQWVQFCTDYPQFEQDNVVSSTSVVNVKRFSPRISSQVQQKKIIATGSCVRDVWFLNCAAFHGGAFQKNFLCKFKGRERGKRTQLCDRDGWPLTWEQRWRALWQRCAGALTTLPVYV